MFLREAPSCTNGVPATQCYACNGVNAHVEFCPVDIGLADPMDRIPRPANHPSVVERFLRYVEVSPDLSWIDFGPIPPVETPCCLWTGGKSRGGDRWSEKAWYGTFNPGGEVKGGVRAHVYIAWLFGLIPDLRVPTGMNLDHRCVQALCVNPMHLELVPKLENQQRKTRR
jgi:hypothetical protein